jgi:serine protease Do
MSYNADINQAIFKVNTSNGSGTSFYLKDRNVFVTNHHVVAGSKEVSLEDHQQNRYFARVIQINPEADIAILKADGEFNTPHLQMELNGLPQSRDQVFVLGYPFGMPFTVTEGIVSAPKQLMEGRYYIQTDAAVNPGNSGGPVVSSIGNVIGITTSKFNNADNVGFAIPIESLVHDLNSLEQNGELQFSLKCNSCGTLVFEKKEYCDNCGGNIDINHFNDSTPTEIEKFCEEAIRDFGINPVLARSGYEFWEFHKGSSMIRIFVYNNNYLYCTSPINNLPTQKLEDFYRYLLSNTNSPYQLGIYENKVYISYREHISAVFGARRNEVKQYVMDFLQKADDMDDYLRTEFGAEHSNFAKLT